MEGNKTRKKKRKKGRFSVLFLSLLMLADFLLTWFGVNTIDYVEERNPLMVWLMELNSFYLALACRLAIIIMVVLLSMVISKNDKKVFNQVVLIGIILNIGVLIIHLFWVYDFYLLTTKYM